MMEVQPQPDEIRHGDSGNGLRTMTSRIRFPKAEAIRLSFDQFALGEGESVYIYGLDASGAVRDVDGPYTAAGPTGSGEFLTRAVAGSDVVIEYHAKETLLDFPFQVSGQAGDGIEEVLSIPAPEEHERRKSIFRGRIVEHYVVDGWAILEGDIILGRAEELELYKEGARELSRESVANIDTWYRWPGGVVPYTISASMTNQSRITDAIAHWNAQLAGSMQFVARTTQTAYVTFNVPASANTCSSYVGYQHSAGQSINIGANCSTGNVIHEIGHAIGFYHEHTRSDRDTYVVVNTANIDPLALGNFTKVGAGTVNIGAYDYGSIMHYGAYAFSINGQPTIVTIPAGIPIGQRNALSAGDITGARYLYPQTQAPVTVTVTSNPAGRTQTVDGANSVGPAQFSWQPNVMHTLVAPNQTVGGTKYLWSSWSNGGSQTQYPMTPLSSTTHTANYAQQYQVVAASSGPGTTSVSSNTHISTDGFYPNGHTIQISAVPNSGYCVSGWQYFGSPLIMRDVQVTAVLQRPHTLTALFQSGVANTPASFGAPPAGGTININVSATSGCVWRVSSQASWVSVVGAYGYGNGTATIQVTPNNTGGIRTATMRFNHTTFTITQSPN